MSGWTYDLNFQIQIRPMTMALIEAVRNCNLVRVKTLLNAGVDFNEREDSGGPTALHEAIRLGYYTIAIQLIDSGADLCLEFRNMTSLIAAAAYNRSDLKNYIQEKAIWSMSSLIEANVLLRSSRIIYKDTSVAYGDRKECQTVEELEKIRYDMDNLRDGAFMVREQILGWDNPLIAQDLILTTHTYDTRPRAKLLLKRWSRGLELLRGGRQWIGDALRYIVNCIDNIVCEVPGNIQIADLEGIFNQALDEIEGVGIAQPNLQTNQDKYTCRRFLWKSIRSTLRLLSIAVEMPKDISERIRLEQTARVFVQLNAEYKWTPSLLHFIFDSIHLEDRRILGRSVMPSWFLFKLLIDAGDSVNSLDSLNTNTVLHAMSEWHMSYNRSVFRDINYNRDLYRRNMKAFHAIMIKLLDCGLHLCATNYCRKSVKDIVLSYDSSDEMKKFAKNYFFLQCAAAKVVKQYNLHKQVGIPAELRKFIELHWRLHAALIECNL